MCDAWQGAKNKSRKREPKGDAAMNMEGRGQDKQRTFHFAKHSRARWIKDSPWGEPGILGQGGDSLGRPGRLSAGRTIRGRSK